MTYEEALAATVSAAEAKAEIEKHDSLDATWELFVKEYGDYTEYSGEDVLDFLGY